MWRFTWFLSCGALITMHLYRQQSLTLYPQELEYHNYFGTIIKPISCWKFRYHWFVSVTSWWRDIGWNNYLIVKTWRRRVNFQAMMLLMGINELSSFDNSEDMPPLSLRHRFTKQYHACVRVYEWRLNFVGQITKSTQFKIPINSFPLRGMAVILNVKFCNIF